MTIILSTFSQLNKPLELRACWPHFRFCLQYSMSLTLICTMYISWCVLRLCAMLRRQSDTDRGDNVSISFQPSVNASQISSMCVFENKQNRCWWLTALFCLSIRWWYSYSETKKELNRNLVLCSISVHYGRVRRYSQRQR